MRSHRVAQYSNWSITVQDCSGWRCFYLTQAIFCVFWAASQLQTPPRIILGTDALPLPHAGEGKSGIMRRHVLPQGWIQVDSGGDARTLVKAPSKSSMSTGLTRYRFAPAFIAICL